MCCALRSALCVVVAVQWSDANGWSEELSESNQRQRNEQKWMRLQQVAATIGSSPLTASLTRGRSDLRVSALQLAALCESCASSTDVERASRSRQDPAENAEASTANRVSRSVCSVTVVCSVRLALLEQPCASCSRLADGGLLQSVAIG